MLKEQVSQQSRSGPGVDSSPAPPSSLPDVNAETYPYEMVQYLLDQTADFNLFAIPDPQYAETATLMPGNPDDWFGLNGGYGLAIRSVLHRFNSWVQSPRPETALKVTQTVGESAGMFQCHCLFGTEDTAWAPGNQPPLAMYDPWRSQRFVMLGGDFRFGSKDRFSSYGIGRTFPVTVNGRPKILVGGVGNLTEGFGKFKGLQGTYTLTGTITPSLGFLGNITVRIIDPDGVIRTDNELPALTAIPDPDPHDTFIVLRGVKKDRTVRTTYGPPPAGNQVSLITPGQMRAARYDCITRGTGGMRSAREVGPVIINDYRATVFFNLLAPPGTADAPVPFTTQEVYPVVYGHGQPIGTIKANIDDGISFGMEFPAAPGQAGVRFAGFGAITEGTGACAGVQGILTVNSLIGIAPHALSLMHVLHIVDLDGKFRTTGRDAS